MKSEKMLEVIIIGLGSITFIILFCFLTTLPAWFLWNWLMPKIFSLRSISIQESFGLVLLSNLLIKSHSPRNKINQKPHG
jgi:hypothetical protein